MDQNWGFENATLMTLSAVMTLRHQTCSSFSHTSYQGSNEKRSTPDGPVLGELWHFEAVTWVKWTKIMGVSNGDKEEY